MKKIIALLLLCLSSFIQADPAPNPAGTTLAPPPAAPVVPGPQTVQPRSSETPPAVPTTPTVPDCNKCKNTGDNLNEPDADVHSHDVGVPPAQGS